MAGKGFQLTVTRFFGLVVLFLLILIFVLHNLGYIDIFSWRHEPLVVSVSLVNEFLPKRAALYDRAVVVFRPDYNLTAEDIAERAYVDVSRETVCLSLGDFTEYPGHNFVLSPNQDFLYYGGSKNFKVRLGVLCDEADFMAEDVVKYYSDKMKTSWLSGCECVNNIFFKNKDCCLIFLRFLDENQEVAFKRLKRRHEWDILAGAKGTRQWLIIMLYLDGNVPEDWDRTSLLWILKDTNCFGKATIFPLSWEMVKTSSPCILLHTLKPNARDYGLYIQDCVQMVTGMPVNDPNTLITVVSSAYGERQCVSQESIYLLNSSSLKQMSECLNLRKLCSAPTT
jgi:hypothetical protein